LAALIAVPAMTVWPEAHRELRLLHLHFNTLGFLGLTAIGTLQVLLPTALGKPDAGATSRLRTGLWPTVGAVLAIGLGASFSLPWALAGALVLSVVGLLLGWGWIRAYGLHAIVSDGAATALGTALLGFLLSIVFGVPADISTRLIAHPEIRKLSFTGSTAVGRLIARQAGEQLKRVTLELGGHAPVIICDDADIERVAKASVFAKFRNAGQVCTSPTRFLVQDGVHDRFVERFAQA
ncbi:aldehyde dehydrogenase family protein, partial [bacterium]|nr:aldehyde dehydrogenase family protein [bacterium]